jgi:nucleotide sugar dehydrogenase
MKISVIGLGKIGLPLAVQYARKGHQIFGVDINSETVDQVNNGLEPFPGEANLQEYLKEVVKEGLLSASLNTAESVTKSDVVVVAVPLFVDENAVPDFTAIDAAAVQIGKGLKKGTLVIFETTLPIGTTRNRIKPLLEDMSGLKGEEDFYLVFSPERVFTGRVFQDLRRYPKLVGGINDESARKAVAFYEEVLDFDERPDLSRGNGVWNLGTCEAAEMAKLAETTYRDVNIGLVNQFAKFASLNGIDIYKVIEACNSQPYSHLHQPGIAVGGHCIPVYPRLYLWKDPSATIISAARAVNVGMPSYLVEKLSVSTGGLLGKKVLILGLAYRGGVKEHAFSGTYPLFRLLNETGAITRVHDPLYTAKEIENLGFNYGEIDDDVEILILQANHNQYYSLGSIDFPGVKYILDGRNYLDENNWSGVSFIRI